ncbi:MAG: lysylphosphatidylglycerol synthase transmembrane domain-containing protein [Candidatus Omnitrophota bacterium]
MQRRTLFNIMRAGISLAVISALVWFMRGQLGTVWHIIRQADRGLLALSFVIAAFSVILIGVRLRIIIAAQGLTLQLRDAVYLVFIGYFFNNFLPTAVGGDMVKAYYLAKKTNKKLASLACVILDRFVGSFTLMLLALIAFLAMKRSITSSTVSVFVLVAALIFGFAAAILFSRRMLKKFPWIKALLKRFRMYEKARAMHEVIYNYKKQPMALLNALLLSVFLQMITFTGMYFIIRSLGYSVSLVTLFLLMPLVVIASMAPSINGLGVRESCFVVLFGPIMSREGALAFGILYFIMYFAFSLAGGVVYAFGGHNRITLSDIKKAEVA